MKVEYALEGDGALVFKCFNVRASLAPRIWTAYFPNLTSVSATLSVGDFTLAQQWTIFHATARHTTMESSVIVL